MKTRLLLVLGMTGFMYMPSQAQYEVYPANARIERQQPPKSQVSEASQSEAALFYCLPQNDIRIKILIDKTTYTRGLYSDYAEQMLKLPAFPDKEESYRLERIELYAEAVPDPSQVYCIRGRHLPKIETTPEGILLSVNRKEMPLSNTLDAGPDALQADVIPVPDIPKPKAAPDLPVPGKHHRNPLPGPHEKKLLPGHGILPVADLNANRRFDTITRQFRTDTGIVIEKLLQPVMDQKSLSEQARKMADKIFKIQADQADLLSGMQEVAYPSGTMRFMYMQLEDTKRQLIEYFTGLFQTERIEYEIRIQLQKGKNTYYVAFFNPESGLEILDPEEQTQSFENQDDLIVLHLQPLPDISMQAFDFEKRNKPQTEPDKGLRYRIPAKVEATLSLNGKQLGHNKNLFIAQWGRTLSLPAKADAQITLDPKTGNLHCYEENPLPQPPTGKSKK